MAYFDDVSDLINQDKLELIVIIAPPRTGSTLLETVVAKSKTVDAEVNEPFVNYGHFGEEPSDGYSKIYSEAIKMLNSQEKATILVKEMSHWIYLEEEYKRLFSLTDKIVFSVRNPLLSTESRIKKYAEPLSIKPRFEVQQWLFNYIAVNRGYDSWTKVKEAYEQGMLKGFSGDKLDFLLHANSTELNMNTQKILLDTYAEIMKFKDWESMLAATFREQNYKPFTDILTADKSSFTLEQLGWGSLGDEAKFLSKIKKDPLIVDSTDLRLMPEQIARELSNRLGINYNPNMIGGWHEQDFSHFITQESKLDKADQFVWYDTLSQSRDIKPPTEKPPELSSFPEPIQEYVRTIAMPIYDDLFASDRRVQIEGGMSHSREGNLTDQTRQHLTPSSGESNAKANFQGRRK